MLQPYTLSLCLAILVFITMVNLRGVRESGLAFMAPTYLFIVSLLLVLAIGVVKTVAGERPSRPGRGAVVRSPAAASAQPLDLDAGVCQRLHGDDRRRGGQQRRDGLPRAGRAACPAHPDGDHRPAGA